MKDKLRCLGKKEEWVIKLLQSFCEDPQKYCILLHTRVSYKFISIMDSYTKNVIQRVLCHRSFYPSSTCLPQKPFLSPFKLNKYSVLKWQTWPSLNASHFFQDYTKTPNMISIYLKMVYKYSITICLTVFLQNHKQESITFRQ